MGSNALHAEMGSIPFYSRDGLRGTYSWRIVKGEPDNQRIHTEVFRRALNALELKEKDDSFRFCTWGDFSVGICLDAELIIASQHLPKHKILLEWTFPIESSSPEKCEEIIRSYRPNDGDMTHWAFHDFEIAVPSNFYPIELKIFPGTTVLQFINHRKHKVTLRRWALPDELMGNRSLSEFSDWLMRRFSRKIVSSEELETDDQSLIRMTYQEKGKFGFESIVGSWWKGVSTTWKDAKKKRVFSYETYGPKNSSMPLFEDVWLS